MKIHSNEFKEALFRSSGSRDSPLIKKKKTNKKKKRPKFFTFL